MEDRIIKILTYGAITLCVIALIGAFFIETEIMVAFVAILSAMLILGFIVERVENFLDKRRK